MLSNGRIEMKLDGTLEEKSEIKNSISKQLMNTQRSWVVFYIEEHG